MIIGARQNHTTKLLIIYKQLVMVFDAIRQGTYRKRSITQAHNETINNANCVCLGNEKLGVHEGVSRNLYGGRTV